LWTSHFRDATNALIEIYSILKVDKINQTNFSNRNEQIITITGSLINKLNEYGDFFQKYLNYTKAFSQRQGIEHSNSIQ
jgi:hypothetical protein